MFRDGDIIRTVKNMDRKIFWVAMAMFVVACATMSVHYDDFADDESETHKEREGKIRKFYIIEICVQPLSYYSYRK